MLFKSANTMAGDEVRDGSFGLHEKVGLRSRGGKGPTNLA